MPQIGEQAPEFTLPGTDGEKIATYTLSDYTDAGCVILAFYMNDFSPVCAEQMCDLDDMNLFQFEEDVTILGISPDYVFSHREFREQKNLDYPLLSDSQFRVAKLFDVLGEKTVEGEPEIQRSLFLLDSDRVVQYKWVAEDNWDSWDSTVTAALKDRLDELRSTEPS